MKIVDGVFFCARISEVPNLKGVNIYVNQSSQYNQWLKQHYIKKTGLARQLFSVHHTSKRRHLNNVTFPYIHVMDPVHSSSEVQVSIKSILT